MMNNAASFDATKPWNAPDFVASIRAPIESPKGMLGVEERRMLYWATNRGYSGRGEIVDAGAFIGASAYCLAAGLHFRAPTDSVPAKVHSFDYFSVVDEYVGTTISRDIRPIQHGESYLDIFHAQTSRFSDSICTYSGDFLSHEWGKNYIGVLFVDICKTLSLNSHVIRNFFPKLVPGESILIHQDFYHVWHPYIHVCMQFLEEYFEVLSHRVSFQSKVFRLIKPIPAEKLDRAVAYSFTAAERLDYLAALAAGSPSPVAEMAELIGLYQRILDRDAAGFVAGRKAFMERHAGADGLLPRSDLWASEAARIFELAQRTFGQSLS